MTITIQYRYNSGQLSKNSIFSKNMLKFSFRRSFSKGYRKISFLQPEGNSESEKHALWLKNRYAFSSNTKAAVQRTALQVIYLSQPDLSKNIHLGDNT